MAGSYQAASGPSRAPVTLLDRRRRVSDDSDMTASGGLS